MPRVPSVSPATGRRTGPDYIHTVEGNFVDNHGRTLLFRGVNLSGSAKAPIGQPSYLRDELFETGKNGDASFIGRPLNIYDGSADVHLARLKGWGFNVLRFPVAWEALEHEGPGKYDYEFMQYTVRVLRKCKQYGFKVFMDPHQDVWSRFSGGSGAPYWTLIACGLDPENFHASQAALLHSDYPSPSNADPASYPAMIWSTNYGRLISQIVFTLFFAGCDYAPKCIIDGQNIQDYLQSHYIAAFGELADIIRDAGDLLDSCIIGWDSLNEPAEGLCGWDDLNLNPPGQGSSLKKGSYPTPAQSMRLGMGQPQTVDHWSFSTWGPRKDGTVTIDPKGYKVWLDPEVEPNGINERWGWTRDPRWKLGICIWALHGVWDIETGYMTRPDYFSCPPFDPDREVVFAADYFRPHWRNYRARIREAHPEAIHFIQPPVFVEPPPLPDPDDLRGRCCYSGHYYDGFTLLTRHWNWFNADSLSVIRGKKSAMWQVVKIGESAIRKSFQEQLGMLKDDTKILGPYPFLIGEIGTPFDMDNKRAYGWTDNGKYAGDYSGQTRALDASLNSADGPNALSYTIWTYCPDSTHEWGDGWNMEDLSLWSADDLRSSQGKMRMPHLSSATLAKSTTALVDVHVMGRPPSSATAASSALTLTTIEVIHEGMEDMGDPQVPQKGGMPDLQWEWENIYDFLTDGARAVQAYSRPYPIALVGLPVDISFDIAKAEFKLAIKVRAEDRPVVDSEPSPGLRRQNSSMSTSSSSASSSRSATPVCDEQGLSELPTEIFVPLIHYAKADMVARSMASQDEQGGSYPESDMDDMTSRSSTPRPDGKLSRADLSALALNPDSNSPPILDLDVQVSAGRWEVEGQILRWWYPVPQQTAEGQEDAVYEHTIQITRARGPIKTGVSAAVSLSSSSPSCWERLCLSESCCVM